MINSEYADLDGGRVVLRFDDTDTRVKPPLVDAYDWIREEFEWLAGRPADVEIRASERMPIYLKYAKKMIEGVMGMSVAVKQKSSENSERLRRSVPAGVGRFRKILMTGHIWFLGFL